MAYYSIFPEKDATIYSHPDRKGLNTGGDEVLELVEEKKGAIYYPSRAIIKFKNTEIRDIIQNKLTGNAKEVNTTNCLVNLQLFSTEHKNLASDHIIEAYPLSQSWEEGTERWTANDPTSSNGCTWIYRTENTSSTWVSGTLAAGTTGSFKNQAGGGTWYTGSNFRSENAFFAEDNLDLNLDVTSVIQKFSASYYQDASYPTGLTNNGFIIKKTLQEEEDDFGFGELKYFSSNTHTIYPPKLTFKWDDSSYSHSGTTLNSGDIFLSLHNNKATFQRKSKQRFRLTTRKRYPDRTFVTSSNYLDIQYLPAASYYSVRDAGTDEVVIPFDTDYTKLSADSEGMYFDLFMEGFQPERYYKLMFRSDNNEGIHIFDEDYFFKVIR
jgi:hypothetical protein